ncbi:hypothetical protein ACJX0J_026501, partial [Zea mays]
PHSQIQTKKTPKKIYITFVPNVAHIILRQNTIQEYKVLRNIYFSENCIDICVCYLSVYKKQIIFLMLIRIDFILWFIIVVHIIRDMIRGINLKEARGVLMYSSFEFVFYLHLMLSILTITNTLSRLDKKLLGEIIDCEIASQLLKHFTCHL